MLSYAIREFTAFIILLIKWNVYQVQANYLSFQSITHMYKKHQEHTISHSFISSWITAIASSDLQDSGVATEGSFNSPG